MFLFRRNCTNIKRIEDIVNINFRRSFCIKSKLKDISENKQGVYETFVPENAFPRCFSSFPESSETAKETEISFNNITNGDKDLEHKLKVIMLEAEVMRQEGRIVPPNSFFTERHWVELLNLPTRTARKKYFEFLFKLSKKKDNKQMKKQEKLLKRKEYIETKVMKEANNDNIEEFGLKYDLQHNNILLRVYDTTINQMYNNKLVQAILFGQKLILDCGYEENMTKRENLNCAKQLMLLFAENRVHKGLRKKLGFTAQQITV